MAYISFQPSDYFNTKLYTGNNSTHAITGVGFQPDFVWLKPRNLVDNHRLLDSVRGNDKFLISNSESGQDDPGSNFASFDSDGFTLGGSDGGWNSSSYNYVSWNWKGGTTSGIATNGSTTITPTAYSFNQTAGISIIQYTGNETAGAKVAHGLGTTPDLMIFKRLDGNTIWQVYHQSLGNTKYLMLNETDAATTGTTRWNDTSPDSVNATLGTTTYLNKSGSPHVGYIFAEKSGFSKFGKYEGNGNVNGTFVYTGFRPAYVLVKKTSSTGSWWLFDNKRLGYNPSTYRLYADDTAAENTTAVIDFVSNGFKFRTTDGDLNGSGVSYVHMAFAEFPTVSSNSKAGTAR